MWNRDIPQRSNLTACKICIDKKMVHAGWYAWIIRWYMLAGNYYFGNTTQNVHLFLIKLWMKLQMKIYIRLVWYILCKKNNQPKVYNCPLENHTYLICRKHCSGRGYCAFNFRKNMVMLAIIKNSLYVSNNETTYWNLLRFFCQRDSNL